jgi:hypothetical protein
MEEIEDYQEELKAKIKAHHDKLKSGQKEKAAKVRGKQRRRPQ